MSAATFAERLRQNTPGKYYVTEQCLDCDLCRETISTVFVRDDPEGVSYVSRQPETREEIELTEEAIEGCPCEAIFDDGDQFDWTASRAPRPRWRESSDQKPKCGHCPKDRKRWWQFWK